MKNILFTLLISSVSLFANSLVGTWSIDETKTKASLKASSLNSNELRFIERFILHTMKTMECSDAHTCLIIEQHNSNPTTGKFTWTSKGTDYLLQSNNKQLIVKPIDDSNIKVIISDMSSTKLETYFKKKGTTLSTNMLESTPLVHVKKQVLTPKKKIVVKPPVVEHKVSPSKHIKPLTPIKIKKIAIPKSTTIPHKERIVNIDIEAEKAEATKKANEMYLQAVHEVM